MPSHTIDAESLRELLDRGESATLLDIRHPEEFEEWSVPGSTNLDAYDALWRNDPDALAGLQPPGQLPVIAICALGKTSLLAAQQLRDRGIEALSLTGGMRAWSLAWNSAEVAISTPGVSLVQVRRTGKGCLSYILGSQDEAMVIDASVDTQVYRSIAEERGWKITSIIDSHIHADHLSRSKKLAELTGATLYLPDQERVAYKFAPVHDSDLIEVGAAKISVISAPGHTEESSCYLLNEKVLFTGDTLFLDGVGRPDLGAGGEESERRARLLYGTLARLLGMPPETIILPGHTARPVAFDGKPLFGRLDDIAEKVKVLSMPEDDFVASILKRIPPTPRNHLRIIELNEAGLIPEADQADLEAGANRCGIS